MNAFYIISSYFSDDGAGGSDEEELVSTRSRRVWTPAEDDILRQAVAVHGESDFRVISSKVPNRSSKQCRERWFNNLAPKIKKTKLSKREWAVVVEAQKELGNRSRSPPFLSKTSFYRPFCLPWFSWGHSFARFPLGILEFIEDACPFDNQARFPFALERFLPLSP